MGFERFAPVERRIDINGRPLSVWRPPDMEALIDLVAFDEDERIPYWADVWESAIVLAEELAAARWDRTHAPRTRLRAGPARTDRPPAPDSP
jgi:hypothetical protein